MFNQEKTLPWYFRQENQISQIHLNERFQIALRAAYQRMMQLPSGEERE